MVSHINQGTAFITGASTGIGAVYADRMARRGYGLFLATATVFLALGATRGLAADVLHYSPHTAQSVKSADLLEQGSRGQDGADVQAQARTVLAGSPNSQAVALRQSSALGQSSSQASSRREVGPDVQDQARGIVRGSPRPDNGNEWGLQLATQAGLQVQPTVHAKSRANGDVQDMAAKILLGHGL
jgi:NAD(P)-dependent dehydrogenase (short-subunit alcohol dehydrogenase family)